MKKEIENYCCDCKTVDFFEIVKNWVRYCDWGFKPGWAYMPHIHRLTKKQRDRIYELTQTIL
jgi:hypothetical protein